MQTFPDVLSSEHLSPNVFALKGWSTSYFQRLDCVYGEHSNVFMIRKKRNHDFSYILQLSDDFVIL